MSINNVKRFKSRRKVNGELSEVTPAGILDSRRVESSEHKGSTVDCWKSKFDCWYHKTVGASRSQWSSTCR